MIEETATVVEANDKQIWVESAPKSGCSACSSSSCGTSAIAKLFGNKRTRLQLENSLGAKAGEQVVLGIPDELLVKASIRAYLFPLLTMVLAATTGNLAGASEGWQALLAMAGLAGGFWLINRTTSNASSAKNFKPKLLRIAQYQPQPVGIVIHENTLRKQP